jgi:uncharacterized phage protein (TIGR01671 family)
MDIKFKAWDKVNKKIYEVEKLYFKDGMLTDVGIDCEGLEGAHQVIPLKCVELMQYTGLNDKNGNEIHKDYILDGSYTNPMNKEKVTQIYLVDFKNGNFYARLIGKSPYGDSLLYFKNQHCEVIGNKWSNPELLEAQNA